MWYVRPRRCQGLAHVYSDTGGSATRRQIRARCTLSLSGEGRALVVSVALREVNELSFMPMPCKPSISAARSKLLYKIIPLRIELARSHIYD